MTGAVMTVAFDGAAALDGLRRLGQVRTPLLRAIGTGLASNTRARFVAGTDPQGRPWQRLNPGYWPLKRGPGILRETGALYGSITFATGADTVTIGSNRIYAGVHQRGAIIRAKTARGLAFRLAIGISYHPARGRTKAKASLDVALVRVMSVTIPARPYLGFSQADRDTVMDVTGVFIAAALQGRPLG